VDIPRIFNITESAHRIHNPITSEKLATLGAALRLESGARVLDLGSGSGEMLCTWARDHGVIGTGIDMSPLFTAQAKLRAVELGVADQVTFIHGNAAGYVSDEKASVAACVGASWIAGGVVGTVELLGAEPAHRRDHPRRRALLAAGTADGGCCQGLSCQRNLRLSHASRTSRIFRPPWLRRR
jgi:SAM-dependent methyltransferase